MILGWKKNTQKQASLCYKKPIWAKNSNANLKNIFEKSKDLNNIFLILKKNLGLKSKSFVVAVSEVPKFSFSVPN